jgi:hypothetical protein
MTTATACPPCAACPACPKCPECPSVGGAGKTPQIALVHTDATTGEAKVVVVPESEVNSQLQNISGGGTGSLPFGLTTTSLIILLLVAGFFYLYNYNPQLLRDWGLPIRGRF